MRRHFSMRAGSSRAAFAAFLAALSFLAVALAMAAWLEALSGFGLSTAIALLVATEEVAEDRDFFWWALLTAGFFLRACRLRFGGIRGQARHENAARRPQSTYQ